LSERLYYRDSFLRDFEAHVISCRRAPGDSGTAPARWWIALDRTAFYPTSGGQPHDTGRLNDAHVSDVFEHESGEMIHVADREIAAGPVRGTIDWPRRFDHAQQHTGSHILTAAFRALFDIPAVSFHMGKEVSTIDVAAPGISGEQLEHAERFANEIIFEDRPVQIHSGTGAHLATLGVQKESQRVGILRAIEIEGVDIQACGGTHVTRTGQIGMILVRGVKKVREHWRVEFVCGQRARRAARADAGMLDELSQRLSCGPDTMHATITRVLNERNAAVRHSERYLEQSANLQAQVLRAQSREPQLAQPPRVVTGVLPDANVEYLRSVAKNIISEPGVVALLASDPGGALVMARSESVTVEMNALLRETVQHCHGKGGGTREFAQGSVPQGTDLHRILRHAEDRVVTPIPVIHVVGRNAGNRAQRELWASKNKNKARG
jgi:alanyl-tRNA synthetase